MDRPRLSALSRALLPGLILPVILVVALGLRLYGIDWDQGHGYHPDERSFYMRADCMYRLLDESPGYSDCITSHPQTEPGFPGLGTFLDADRSPVNPHWFPLGSILIYLMVALRFLVEPFTDLDSLQRMSYAGRSIMALADVGSVFIVYLLGKRIYGRRAGLLAAALLALAVVHIQHSHFYRPEPLLVFFLLASFWSMLQVMEKRRLGDSLLLGLFVGLTFATKVSVLALVLPLVLVYSFRLFTTPEGSWSLPSGSEVSRLRVHAILAAVVAAGAFLATTPYALLDMGDFVGDITWQATNVARTAGKVPFTVQYVGTTPFLYELKQTSLWALGLPLGVVAWGGLLFTMVRGGKFLLDHIGGAARGLHVPRGEYLLLAWVVPNVVLLSVFEVKFLRYIVPVIPFLILMGAGMLFSMLDRARSIAASPPRTFDRLKGAGRLSARYMPHAVIGVVVFVVAATAFYALSFETVYARTHPAIQASRWINENVPVGSTIVTDNHWDEGIRDIYSYKVRQIPIYDPDAPAKMAMIAGHLAEGDYLVFYSNRTYGSVARLPERYPLSSRYYHLLFSEELGYRLERAFTSYPELFGVAFVDDTFGRAGLPEPQSLKTSSPATLSLNLGYADENVANYDHPKVLLFRNVDGLRRSQLYDVLTDTAGETPQLGLMLSSDRKASQREGGTWSEFIKRESWTNKVPVLAWLLLVEVIYLAALPLAIFLFRPLPDRGVVLAKLLGILAVSYVAWLLPSLGWMSFSRASVLMGILALAFLSALVLIAKWREVKDFLIRNWRLLAIGEVLFLVAFLSFVAIRMANPDLWHPYRGGEKPMDFAYLNAVLRSTYMPPFDPWFAGGYLNYYYWGQFIVATLIKGTGIIPSVAYNLAIPLLFALTVTGAYSLIYNVTAGIRRLGPALSPSTASASEVPVPTLAEANGPPPESWWGRWRYGVPWGPVIAGLVAGLFVAVIGNLDGIAQIVKGGWNNAFRGEAFPSLDYISDFWRSSRMLPKLEDVDPSALTFWLPDRVGSNPDIGHHITEFPFFSFLFADLHAHMIVIPFTLLAVGLAFSLLVGIRSSRGWWLVLTTVALAVAVGALWAINSWDYPSYVLLAVLFLGLGVYLKPGRPLVRLGTFLVLAPGFVLLSILAFLPFHVNYHPFPTGLDVSKWQTPLLNYLGIHGLFLFLIVSFLAYVSRHRLRALLGHLVRGPSGYRYLPVRAFSGLRRPSAMALIWLLGLLLIVYMAVAGYWTAALLSTVLAFTIWAGRDVLAGKGEGASFSVFPLALIVLALCIGIGVEFVRAQDDIGRMNTLFKYYLEAWILFGLASAYLLWYMGTNGFFRLRGISITRGAWLAVLAILLASSFIYPVLGTRNRLADRFDTGNMTLDGADYMRTAVHFEEGQAITLRWDYDAIRWLQDYVQGSPVVLEAQTPQYRWGSRVADYTGLPTVLGWRWHQEQQRMKYSHAVRGRASVVQEIYSTLSEARALELLRLHDVEYVMLGELERAYYSEHGLGKFDRLVQRGLAQVVYENEGVKIYKGLWYN